MNPKDSTGHRLLPRLSLLEWSVFCVLAAVMAAINIYSTLLIGWGDGGSIIAVIAAVMFLGFMGRQADLEALNLAQTLVSAGGSVGFAVASYAAVHLVDPQFSPNPWILGAMFIGMGFLGTIIGSSVRKYMVKYYFPSGTACAVIAKTVSEMDASPEGKRPVWLLKVYGGIAALVAIPTKITLVKGASSIINDALFAWTSIKGVAIGTAVNPLLYGIGIVVGPRVGLGMVIGAAMPIAMSMLLEPKGIPATEHGLWVRWMAIAVLTLPTFASILFAFVYRQAPVIPDGFTPGSVQHGVPRSRNLVYSILGLIGLLITSITAQHLFALPFHIVILTAAISWPLCVINGRVTGDTDINPVRLVAIVLLSVFAMIVAKDAVLLLGIAVIGSTMAAMAVDMMQDYKTGFLVNGNPTHQTSVQFIGIIFGSLAAIPFFFLIKSKMGIGAGSSLPAPGAQIWATIAESFTGNTSLGSDLLTMLVIASIAFSLLSYFAAWPKTAALIPSVFGIGIGLLLGFQACFAIFLGGIIKWLIIHFSQRGLEGDAKIQAKQKGANDTMLIGAGIFAAAALVSIILLVLTEGLKVAGIEWWYLGH